MGALTRDAILSVSDLATESVPVPEWGGDVLVKTLTGAERDAFEQACENAKKGKSIALKELKARLVAMAVCDERGAALFTAKDIPDLNKKNSKAIDRLFKAAQRLSGLSNDDVEQLAGNSSGDQSDDSGSA